MKRTKKLLFVMGSPRNAGNCAAILASLKERIGSSEYEIEVLNLNDYTISGCRGCSACQNSKEFHCVQSDDANLLLDKIVDADMVLYSTPLYGHNYSGQMKIFLDRHVPLFKFVAGEHEAVEEMKIISAIENKPVALAVSCQGPEEHNTDLITLLFDRFCQSSLAQNRGVYVFPFCNKNAAESFYEENTFQKLENALRL